MLCIHQSAHSSTRRNCSINIMANSYLSRPEVRFSNSHVRSTSAVQGSNTLKCQSALCHFKAFTCRFLSTLRTQCFVVRLHLRVVTGRVSLTATWHDLHLLGKVVRLVGWLKYSDLYLCQQKWLSGNSMRMLWRMQESERHIGRCRLHTYLQVSTMHLQM
jgi:hypothetical protein